jgi:Kef-type K+ transport system membrane component KefB
LSELKLLQDPVGLTTLAAGVGNDVVGWVLLALAVTLANAGEGITALYIILTGVGLILVLHFLIRPAFLWYCRRTGSLENGPTSGVVFVTFFAVFATAWITDIIGIHAIFGSFLVGLLVVPHHHGFAVKLTEKIEDMISILFVPIYFTLSGLKTDLGLLNNGAIWGYVVCVCIVAFASKFLSCAAAAKWGGFGNRESAAIGSLMACKG